MLDVDIAGDRAGREGIEPVGTRRTDADDARERVERDFDALDEMADVTL